MKFKAFLTLVGLTYVIAQGYSWAYNTSISEIGSNLYSSIIQKKDDFINQTKQSITSQIDTVNDSAKSKAREVINSSLDKIGIEKQLPKEKEISEKNNKKDEEIKKVTTEYQLKFKYDSTGAPDGLKDKDMINLIAKASKIWETACGIKFIYEGTIRSDYIAVDNEGTSRRDFAIIRWSNLDAHTLGTAHLGGKNGPVGDFIMNLNSNSFSKNGALNQDSLYATIIHELGHTIGLPHSRLPESIMYFQQNYHKPIAQLNVGDQQMCLENVSQWKSNPINQKYKI